MSDENESESEPEDMRIMRQHVEQLGEHFDSVQIFATRHEAGIEDGTVSCNLGSGNWFARYGQVKEWLVKRDEQMRQVAREEE
jgi:hypothetical protein